MLRVTTHPPFLIFRRFYKFYCCSLTISPALPLPTYLCITHPSIHPPAPHPCIPPYTHPCIPTPPNTTTPGLCCSSSPAQCPAKPVACCAIWQPLTRCMLCRHSRAYVLPSLPCTCTAVTQGRVYCRCARVHVLPSLTCTCTAVTHVRSAACSVRVHGRMYCW